MPTVVSNLARQLRRQTADCIRARSEETLTRTKGDSDLGWIARTQEQEDEAVFGKPARMAANRDAAGVFSRLESGRGFMEQHQRTGTGQPLCCWTWRGRRPCSQRHGSRAPIQAAVFFPTPRGTLF